MGNWHSHENKFQMENYNNNGPNPFDSLPDELVEYIFLLLVYSPRIEPFNHVKSSSTSPFYFSYRIHERQLRRAFKDLMSSEMVCRRFYKLLRSPTFWLRKCHRELPIVNEPLAIAQGVDFRRLYFSNPFHPDYNLLALNGINGDNLRKLWDRSVIFQEVPSGSERLYDAFGRISSCYATSYMWGHFRCDSIPLVRKGEEQVSSIKIYTYDEIFCDFLLAGPCQSSN
jgi:hypothetical protein